jgi:hypothetical protein
MVSRKKHVVEAEPERQQAAREPAVSGTTPIRMLARDMEVDHSDVPAWFQDLPGAVDGGKPVGNHCQRVRKGDDVDQFRQIKRGRVRDCGRDVFPTLLLNSPFSHIEQRRA